MPGKKERERELARRRYERRAARMAAAQAKKRRRLQVIAVVMVVLLLFAGAAYGITKWVGGNDNDTLATPPVPTANPAAPPTPLPLADRPAALRHKPDVEIPKGKAPTKLVTKDLVVGKGAAAGPGDQLVVNYVGKVFASGKEFDASWKTGQPLPFTLGTGQVIPGWDQGVAGMKVGGRRMLVIPPSLGYGATPSGKIPANSTLVFVVDLLGDTPAQ